MNVEKSRDEDVSNRAKINAENRQENGLQRRQQQQERQPHGSQQQPKAVQEEREGTKVVEVETDWVMMQKKDKAEETART